MPLCTSLAQPVPILVGNDQGVAYGDGTAAAGRGNGENPCPARSPRHQALAGSPGGHVPLVPTAARHRCRHHRLVMSEKRRGAGARQRLQSILERERLLRFNVAQCTDDRILDVLAPTLPERKAP